MFPAAKGNYWRAAVTALIAAVLLVTEAVGLIHLLRGPAYPPSRFLIIPMMLVLFLPMGIFVLTVGAIQILRQERDLRAALDGDEQRAPRARIQPNQTKALGRNERLTLTRTMNLRTTWWVLPFMLVGAPFFAAMMAYLGELCVYVVSPHAAGWIVLLPLQDNSALLPYPPPALSPLEWLVLALAAAPGIAFSLLALWGQVAALRQTIRADDAGISVHGMGEPRQLVPWDDIHAVIATGPDPAHPGSLLLRGNRHGITLLLGTGPLPPRADGKPRAAMFKFPGGTDAYRDGVERLVATVVSRTHVPVRTLVRPSLRSARGRIPLPGELTPDAMLHMPLAPAAYQPPAPSREVGSSAMSRAVEPVALADTIPASVLVRRTLLICLMWCGAVAVIFLMFVILGRMNPGGSFPAKVSQPWVLAGLAAFLVLMSWFLALVTYRDDVAPTLVGDGAGIRLRKFNGMPSATMLWNDIRAWAVIAPDDLMQIAPTYVLFSDSQTLSWREPTTARLAGRSVSGDRHEAYVATAQRLHALIALRTGLPLRQIVPLNEWSADLGVRGTHHVPTSN